MPLLDHLRDRLTRDIGSSRLWRNPLFLSGGIFEGAKRFCAEFRNIDPKTRLPRRKFEYSVHEVTRPMVFIGDSGTQYVTEEDANLLLAQAKIRPAKREDHLGLLAAVYRRVASNRKNGVSPWCQATFLSSETEGARTQRFAKPGDPEGPVGMQAMLAGVDAFEMTKEILEHMQRQRVDPTLEMPDMTDAGQRSVKGRK